MDQGVDTIKAIKTNKYCNNLLRAMILFLPSKINMI